MRNPLFETTKSSNHSKPPSYTLGMFGDSITSKLSKNLSTRKCGKLFKRYQSEFVLEEDELIDIRNQVTRLNPRACPFLP
jgi:hypothetical protein